MLSVQDMRDNVCYEGIGFIIYYVPCSIVWTIWMEQNGRILNGSSADLSKLHENGISFLFMGSPYHLI